MTRGTSRLTVVLLLGCIAAMHPAGAQTIYGSLAGTVYDPSQAVIPNAKVVVRSLDTGLTRETASDITGFWRVPSLAQGKYSVEITASNFERMMRAPLEVEPTVERAVDMVLNPGSTTSIVTVLEQAPLIESTKAQISHSANVQEILSLPGLNSRDGLALLQPGTAPNDLSGRPGSGFVVNGARTRSNNFMIDGANNNDQSLMTPRQNLPPEVLGEFRIITNNFSAEFGRNAGSVVQQSTKAGTNELHSTIRWAWLGNGLDALRTGEQRTFNAQKATGKTDYLALRASRGVLVRNQAVFSAGGPIKKDHTFVFAAYDIDRRRSTASPVAATISPEGFRLLEQNQARFARGTVDFLKATFPVANDPTSRGSQTVRLGDGGTISIPIQQYNRAAQGALPYARNFHRGLIRVDTRLSGKDSLFARYVVDDDLDPGTPNAIAANQLGSAGRNQNGTISHVRVVSPSLISESRAVYGRRSFHYVENYPPQFAISGSGLPTIGNQNFPQFRTDNLYEFTNNWSCIRGRHTARFGANLLRYQLNSFFAPASMGVITYPSFEDFLFDRSATFQQYAGDGMTASRTTEFAGFFADDFRATNTLTLNMGIRYEYTGAPYGYFSNAKPDINNWAPRFGFAWSPRWSEGLLGKLAGNGKLAVRGGYAISYDQVFQNILLNNSRNYPRGVTVTFDQMSGGRLWDGASRPAPPKPQDYKGDPNQLPVRLFSPNKRIMQPYGQQFSFGIERQFQGDYAFKVFYVGSRGVKLVREVEQNLGFYAAAVNATPSVYAEILPTLQAVRDSRGAIASYKRDPSRGSILVADGFAQSVYHSLQVSADKRFSKGFTYQASYTWSAFINDSDDILGGSVNRTLPAVPFALKLDRARSAFDQPHRFVSSYIYETPAVREGRGLVGRIASAWTISGITTLAKGTPYGILNANNALGILPGQITTVHLSQRAGFNPGGAPGTPSNASVANPRYIAHANNSGIIGNLGANTERVGRTVNFDVSLGKNIKTWAERKHELQLRWEITNSLNFRTFNQLPPLATVSANTNLTQFMNLGQTDVVGRTMLFNVRYVF